MMVYVMKIKMCGFRVGVFLKGGLEFILSG